MKRLQRTQGATGPVPGVTQTTAAPAAQPAPAPVAPAPVQQVAQAQATVPATTQAAPMVGAAMFADMPGAVPAGYAQDSVAALGAGESMPYLGFHHNQGKRAQDVLKAIHGVVDGTPFIWDGERVHDARGLDVMVLEFFPYWEEREKAGAFRMLRATVEPQPFGSELKKNVLAVLLHVPGSRQLPEELAPAFATLTTFRSTKCPIVEKHVLAVQQTMEPNWLAGKGALEQAVMSFPPAYRVASEINLKTVTGSGGMPYQKGEAQPHVLTVDQGRAVTAFLSDPDMREELAAVLRQFKARKAAIELFARGQGSAAAADGEAA